MSLIDILLLSIALGIDCFVVSFSQGLVLKNDRIRSSLYLAVIMGLFQGLMPYIGYIGTNSLYNIILPFSKCILFGIFFILGMKFIFESFEQKEENSSYVGIKCLLALGVATSIDALVSGATLKLTSTNLILSTFMIGLASFVMSLLGFWSTNFLKRFPSKYLEIAGGMILILLAIKSLL